MNAGIKSQTGKKEQERLFLLNPYQKEAEAKILRKLGNKVIPDKTVLFSFSGGQQPDSGTIGGVNVIGSELVEFAGGMAIEYELEHEPEFKEGDSVMIKLDWEKRLKLMRLHSAAHIAFFIFKEVSELEDNIGSNVSSNKARLDYAFNENISGFLAETEEKCNALINEGHEIKIWEEKQDEESGKEPVRHWKCLEWDMPCSGLHVRNTKEIGRIRLKRANIGKGKERLEVLLAE